MSPGRVARKSDHWRPDLAANMMNPDLAANGRMVARPEPDHCCPDFAANVIMHRTLVVSVEAAVGDGVAD